MSEFHADDSVEMESVAEHTYNGVAYKPGNRFRVTGDGGGWSSAMFADSLTALGHAKRAEPKHKTAKFVEEPAAEKPAEQADAKKTDPVAAEKSSKDKAHYNRKDLKAK